MASADPVRASCTSVALGMPCHSSSTESRKLRALQLPQPPKPVTATVASDEDAGPVIGLGRDRHAALDDLHPARERRVAPQLLVEGVHQVGAPPEAVGHEGDDGAVEAGRSGGHALVGRPVERTARRVEPMIMRHLLARSFTFGQARRHWRSRATTGSVTAQFRWGNRIHASPMPAPPAATNRRPSGRDVQPSAGARPSRRSTFGYMYARRSSFDQPASSKYRRCSGPDDHDDGRAVAGEGVAADAPRPQGRHVAVGHGLGRAAREVGRRDDVHARLDGRRALVGREAPLDVERRPRRALLVLAEAERVARRHRERGPVEEPRDRPADVADHEAQRPADGGVGPEARAEAGALALDPDLPPAPGRSR